MTAAELSQVAAILGTTDKNVVFSFCIKTLIDAGVPVRDAFDRVLGEGRWNEMANDLYERFNAK